MCNHLLAFFFIMDWKNKLSIHIDLLSIFRFKGEAWYRMPKTSTQWRHEMNYLIVASVEKLFVIIVLNTFFCLFLNFIITFELIRIEKDILKQIFRYPHEELELKLKFYSFLIFIYFV